MHPFSPYSLPSPLISHPYNHPPQVDKSLLTGESKPVKVTADPDRSPGATMLHATNICFMGCNVVEGQGVGFVIATGADNQLAKIAAQVGNTSLLPSPLLDPPVCLYSSKPFTSSA